MEKIIHALFSSPEHPAMSGALWIAITINAYVAGIMLGVV